MQLRASLIGASRVANGKAKQRTKSTQAEMEKPGKTRGKSKQTRQNQGKLKSIQKIVDLI